MNMFEEILWPQFVKLNYIKDLSLNEQVYRYNVYLEELSRARQRYYMEQEAGGTAPSTSPDTPIPPPVTDSYLQQENLDYILQEDNSLITI